MSSAIDFDFSAVRMQSSPWHTGAKSRLYADQVSTSRDDDREGFQAHAVAQDDQPYIPGETKFCGITFKQWGPDTGKWIECVSWGLSCTALVVTSGFGAMHTETQTVAMINAPLFDSIKRCCCLRMTRPWPTPCITCRLNITSFARVRILKWTCRSPACQRPMSRTSLLAKTVPCMR